MALLRFSDDVVSADDEMKEDEVDASDAEDEAAAGEAAEWGEIDPVVIRQNVEPMEVDYLVNVGQGFTHITTSVLDRIELLEVQRELEQPVRPATRRRRQEALQPLSLEEFDDCNCYVVSDNADLTKLLDIIVGFFLIRRVL